jgi:hypothetical protein
MKPTPGVLDRPEALEIRRDTPLVRLPRLAVGESPRRRAVPEGLVRETEPRDALRRLHVDVEETLGRGRLQDLPRVGRAVVELGLPVRDFERRRLGAACEQGSHQGDEGGGSKRSMCKFPLEIHPLDSLHTRALYDVHFRPRMPALASRAGCRPARDV